ncbi:MFS transporter [Nocardia sp. CNY236]|uniref:MFS transporter n=1 Tax=Nocardia sp. CNY236 TaxID=1169152 RepID=UPI0003FA8B88|nr:MFS transporter [Nocardia sp. CNY236]
MTRRRVEIDRGTPQHSTVTAYIVLTVACAAQFMVVLDISVVNVALPSIRDALHFGESGQQWVVNAYALVFAGFLLLGGRLADLYGHRRVFMSGLALFAAASLACGLATSGPLLVGARALQGLGAAVLAPATLTLVTTAFPEGPARVRALATWTAVGVAGGTAGNLVGGVLTEYLSWRATLLLNVPIAVAAVLATMRFVHADRPENDRPRVDIVGAVLATGGLATLAFGISRAAEVGWASTSAVLGIGIGAILLVVFGVAEKRNADSPLIPLRLFAIRSVSVGNVAMLLAGASLNPMWFFLTLSMQTGLGYSPVQTGLAFLPHTIVTIVVAARVTPWLMRRVEGRVLIATGSLLAAAGFCWQAQLGEHDDYLTGILGPAIVFSIGTGLLNTPITAAVTSGVPTGDAGAASGLMNTTKQVGGALGLAILVTVAAAHGTDAPMLLEAYNRAFYAIAAVMVAVAIVAAALPARNDRNRPAGQRPR